MALNKCPDCGHDVSDMAVCCPNCGRPVEKSSSLAPVKPVEHISAEAFFENPNEMLKNHSGAVIDYDIENIHCAYKRDRNIQAFKIIFPFFGFIAPFVYLVWVKNWDFESGVMVGFLAMCVINFVIPLFKFGRDNIVYEIDHFSDGLLGWSYVGTSYTDGGGIGFLGGIAISVGIIYLGAFLEDLIGASTLISKIISGCLIVFVVSLHAFPKIEPLVYACMATSATADKPNMVTYVRRMERVEKRFNAFCRGCVLAAVAAIIAFFVLVFVGYKINQNNRAELLENLTFDKTQICKHLEEKNMFFNEEAVENAQYTYTELSSSSRECTAIGIYTGTSYGVNYTAKIEAELFRGNESGNWYVTEATIQYEYNSFNMMGVWSGVAEFVMCTSAEGDRITLEITDCTDNVASGVLTYYPTDDEMIKVNVSGEFSERYSTSGKYEGTSLHLYLEPKPLFSRYMELYSMVVLEVDFNNNTLYWLTPHAMLYPESVG